MDEKQFKLLRGAFHGLLEQKKVLEDSYLTDKGNSRSRGKTNNTLVSVLKFHFDLLEKEFPGLLPVFNPDDFNPDRYGQYTYYDTDGIRSFIGFAIGRIEVYLGEDQENTPVTQKKEFSFIKDQDVKKIVERDYSEIQRAFISKCSKSVIILCGGAIEAILLDKILQDEPKAKSSSKAPKQLDLKQWGLADLINVTVDLGFVSTGGLDKLSHSVRGYRNLIHPGNEIRKKLIFGEEEARIAIEVLNILHRELSKQ